MANSGTLPLTAYTSAEDTTGVYRTDVNQTTIQTDWLKEVESITRESGYGDLKRSNMYLMRGLNFRGLGNPVVSNLDNSGICFMTRPRCCLTYDNLGQDRKMSQLGTNEPMTLQRAVRCYLDHVGETHRGITTPLVDPRLPFMPLLTNTLISLSGWPDPVLDYWTSPAGIWRESTALVDGLYKQLGVFNLQANFTNVPGDPISLLIDSWCTYASNIYNNIMTPYPDQVVDNEVDYQTRIYMFVLDPGRRYIQKWANTGAAFPTSTPMGAAFNFDATRPYNFNNQQISVPFTCIGAEYNDPIVLKEFNDLVGDWYSPMNNINVNMTTGELSGPSTLKQLTTDEVKKYNYMALPYINLATNELTWWLTPSEYESITTTTSTS